MPTIALHITAKLAAISQLMPVSAGARAPAPLAHAAAAAASTSPMLANAARPPTFWIHLPTARPRMFAIAISASQPTETPSTNSFWLTSASASASPPANAKMPAM